MAKRRQWEESHPPVCEIGIQTDGPCLGACNDIFDDRHRNTQGLEPSVAFADNRRYRAGESKRGRQRIARSRDAAPSTRTNRLRHDSCDSEVQSSEIQYYDSRHDSHHDSYHDSRHDSFYDSRRDSHHDSYYDSQRDSRHDYSHLDSNYDSHTRPDARNGRSAGSRRRGALRRRGQYEENQECHNDPYGDHSPRYTDRSDLYDTNTNRLHSYANDVEDRDRYTTRRHRDVEYEDRSTTRRHRDDYDDRDRSYTTQRHDSDVDSRDMSYTTRRRNDFDDRDTSYTTRRHSNDFDDRDTSYTTRRRNDFDDRDRSYTMRRHDNDDEKHKSYTSQKSGEDGKDHKVPYTARQRGNESSKRDGELIAHGAGRHAPRHHRGFVSKGGTYHRPTDKKEDDTETPRNGRLCNGGEVEPHSGDRVSHTSAKRYSSTRGNIKHHRRYANGESERGPSPENSNHSTKQSFSCGKSPSHARPVNVFKPSDHVGKVGAKQSGDKIERSPTDQRAKSAIKSRRQKREKQINDNQTAVKAESSASSAASHRFTFKKKASSEAS